MSMTEANNISNNDIYRALMNLTTQNKEIKNEITSLKTEFQTRTDEIQKSYGKLLEENKQLKEKIRLGERRAKKNNIIIHGCQERENENVINTILALINGKLGVELAIHDVNNAYRLGVKKVNSKARLIRVELITYQKKISIITQTKKLKGTNIYIADDLTLEDLQERKLLTKHLINARKNNLPAKIRNFKLIVNGETYSYEDLKKNPLETEENNEIDISNFSPPPQRKSLSLPSTPSVPQEAFPEAEACVSNKDGKQNTVTKTTQNPQNLLLSTVSQPTKKGSTGEIIRSSERLAKIDRKHKN